MSQHFLENIKIENFKCFENLEINDFKRVNVFGGKNNVGKTSLLEAIELLVKSKNQFMLVHNTRLLLKRRRQEQGMIELDIFRIDALPIFISSSMSMVKITLPTQISLFENESNEGGVIFAVGDEKSEMIEVSLRKFIEQGSIFVTNHTRDRSEQPLIASEFIKSSKSNDKEISALYGAVIEFDKEEFLNNSLSSFDGSIVAFKVIPTENKVLPKIKLEGRNRLVSLSSLGDGVNRYISILCAIWKSQNGFLFIDEIENGIHYSNYKKLWELIFMASEQANCQVFVTSHSKECITAFNDVQQERADDAGRYFELYRSQKKQRIVAAVRDAEQLHYSLTHGAAIRGE